jgi:hypothetical protein
MLVADGLSAGSDVGGWFGELVGGVTGGVGVFELVLVLSCTNQRYMLLSLHVKNCSAN